MPISEPTINIELSGILVLFIKDGAETCEVKFLRDPPPNHVLTIDFTQHNVGGTAQIVRQLTAADIKPGVNLRLEVQNPTQPGVHLFTQRRFDRKNNLGDKNDFRWVVDFERDIYGGNPIEFIPEGFLSTLSINNGKFFTQLKSIDTLIVRDESGQETDIGKVAVGIGAHIFLDSPDSTAVFMNGDEKVFEFSPEPGITYGIRISQSPPPPPVSDGNEPLPDAITTADADSYRTVVVPHPSLNKSPVTFAPPSGGVVPDGVLPISQHAACFTGGGG